MHLNKDALDWNALRRGVTTYNLHFKRVVVKCLRHPQHSPWISTALIFFAATLWLLFSEIDFVPGEQPANADCERDIGAEMGRHGHLEELLWTGCLIAHDTKNHFARYTTVSGLNKPPLEQRPCLSCHDGAQAPTFARMWTIFPRFNSTKGRVEDFAQAIQDEIAIRYGGTIPVRSDTEVSELYVYAFTKAKQEKLSFALDDPAAPAATDTELEQWQTTPACRALFERKGRPRGANAPWITAGCNLVTDTYNRMPAPFRIWRTDMKCDNCHRHAGNLRYAGDIGQGAVLLPIMMTPLNKPIRFDRRVLMCFARSLNWFDMGRDASALTYIYMYSAWLAEKDQRIIGDLKEGRGIPMIYDTDGFGSSVLAGERVYRQHCIRCHGPNAWGRQGPVYNGIEPPPIAGPYAFTDLATTAARTRLAGFIYNNMPPGATHDQPILSVQESLDVGIYLEHLGRPANFVEENRIQQFMHYLWLKGLYHGVYGLVRSFSGGKREDAHETVHTADESARI